MKEGFIDVYRGEYVESKHRVHIAVVDFEGNVLCQVGDIEQFVFGRSSMKPIQALSLIESGAADTYQFSEADISLACASHNGEAQHTERVQEILERLHLTTDDLRCGTHAPRWDEAYRKIILEHREITQEYNNCSGKHSGMLATTLQMKADTNDYYKIEHPVQQHVLQIVSDMTEIPTEEIRLGVDGCGLPVHAVPLKNLALAFAKLAQPKLLSEARQKAIHRVTDSMMHEPAMVGGTERFCTDFMRVMDGAMFGKAGAEGVYCVGVKERGIGIALKVEDGNGRATSTGTLEVLKQLKLISDEQLQQLDSYMHTEILNGRKEVVGKLVPRFQLECANIK